MLVKVLKKITKERPHILCVWPQVGVSQDFNVIGNPGNVAREIPTNPGIQIYRSMDFSSRNIMEMAKPELSVMWQLTLFIGGSTFPCWQTLKHSQ